MVVLGVEGRVVGVGPRGTHVFKGGGGGRWDEGVKGKLKAARLCT